MPNIDFHVRKLIAVLSAEQEEAGRSRKEQERGRPKPWVNLQSCEDVTGAQSSRNEILGGFPSHYLGS